MPAGGRGKCEQGPKGRREWAPAGWRERRAIQKKISACAQAGESVGVVPDLPRCGLVAQGRRNDVNQLMSAACATEDVASHAVSLLSCGLQNGRHELLYDAHQLCVALPPPVVESQQGPSPLAVGEHASVDLHVGCVVASFVLRSDGAVPDVGVLCAPFDLGAFGCMHASLQEEALQNGPDIAVGRMPHGCRRVLIWPLMILLSMPRAPFFVNAKMQRPGYEVGPDDCPCLYPGGGQCWAEKLAPEAKPFFAAFGPSGPGEDLCLFFSHLLVAIASPSGNGCGPVRSAIESSVG